MQCPHCQHESRETARFCAACGHAFAVSCTACGNQHPPGAAFCDNCGTRLARPTPEPSPMSLQAREPLSYTPRHLVDKILTSRSALEGQRKQVTMLFCDLANSTAIAARLGPENMHALLNRFFDLALDAVHRFEGTVNQFLGDGFMALFGAPIAHEDHARRAVLAALALQQTLHDQHAALGEPTA
jgi:class 3 adenylate cyclase